MKPKGSADCFSERKARTDGGVFDKAELVERLHQAPPAPLQAKELHRGRWLLRTLREQVKEWQDFTLSGIWYALKRAGVRWRPAVAQQWSPDPEYTQKLAHLLACLQQAGQATEDILLIFMDEAGFNRWPEPAKTWAEVSPTPPPQAEHGGHDNNTQWRLIAGLNAFTAQVTYLSNYIVGRRQVIAWYGQLDATYPKAKKLYVAQDNWSIHTHPDVLEALKQFPRIEPLWLPTYSHWLNPMEKLWRWLKVDLLKMHRLAQDWHELRHQVELFLAQFAQGSQQLLRYVGLLGDGKLAQALRGQ